MEEITKDWEEVKLGDITTIKTGKRIEKINDGKYPIFGSNGIIGYTKAQNFENKIIIGRVGAYCGTVNYYPDKFWATDNTLIIDLDRENDIIFWSCFLKSYPLNEFSGGAAQPLLTQGLLKGMKFLTPPLTTQQKIASVLSAYDDLIENNLKRIEVLEEMAQQTYEEWFVRMKYPGHETDELNPETGLPEGWEQRKAKEVYKITIGKTPPRRESEWFNPEEINEQVKWASITDIRNSSVYLYTTKETITKEAATRFNFNLIEKGNIMLSFKLTVGLVAIANENMTTNEAIAHFNQPADIPTSYTYYFLKNFDFDSLGSTSSIGNAINSKIVKSIPFIIPEKRILREHNKLVKPILGVINNLNIQNQHLREARNLLLPRLMMGLIDVEVILES